MGTTQTKPEKIVSHFSNTQTKGETPCFRSAELPLDVPVHDKLPGGIDTLLKCFESSRERLGPRPMYGTREKLPNGELGKYHWKSFDEIYEIVTSLAKACEELELCPTIEDEGRKVRALGIFCKTREEWMCTWIATWYLGGCIVPLYDTLGEESIEWIIKQAELHTVVTTTPFIGKLAKLKLEGRLDFLKTVITIEEPTKEEAEALAKSNLRLLRYRECIEIGKKSKVVLNSDVTPDSLATICYTSGTTSKPKGVMLTHRNYTSMIMGITNLPYLKPKLDHSCICWLPLAHVFEQFTAVVCIAMGVKVGFYSGEVIKLVNDLQELKPQYFGSVPRVFNRIYEQTNKQVATLTGFKKWLYNRAVAAKLARLRSTGNYTHSFYDRFVFAKVRNMTGGNLQVIFVGGAPLSPEVQEMSRIWLSCAIVQGYGQTETTGPICAQDDNDIYPCSIGRPLIHAEAKLVDIPEMKYFSTDTTDGKPTPRGEIMLRGPGVSPGYWRDPVMSKETFTEDGWVHTGDVGKMSPWGHLTIIDRKKHIFKLAQGEYIAPESLENLYQRSTFVSQIFVTGDSYNNFLVAIVVPRPDTATAWAKSKGLEAKYEEICENPEFKLDLLRDLEKIAREAKRNGLEFVKNAYLTPTPFSVENDTMTPTQKIKRYQAGKMYEDQIKKMYTSPIPDIKKPAK